MDFNRPPFPPYKEDGLMKSLYKGPLRPMLPIAASKWVSDVGGMVMSSKISKNRIKHFIKSNNIDMRGYEGMDFPDFNSFFTRPIPRDLRPIDMTPGQLTSSCDAKITFSIISDSLTFEIKGGRYSVRSLLKNAELARELEGGICLIYRLSVDDLHRYVYFDSGKKGPNIRINGRYYSVRPSVLDTVDFYKENTREYTVMETENFGRCVQVEVGATFVGRINNHHEAHRFTRGEEKGLFEFGGSTIVLLLPRGAARIDEDIVRNSQKSFETKVKLGEHVGESLISRGL